MTVSTKPQWGVFYSVASFGEHKAGPYKEFSTASEHLLDVRGYDGVSGAHIAVWVEPITTRKSEWTPEED